MNSGKLKRQRLPVLEDVPPVAFVGQQRFAASVLQRDREPVPRAARIAVTAAEGDRQVLAAEPFQLRVAGPFHGRQQVLHRKGRVQAVQHPR